MPRRGPVILASNHLSFSDHFFGPLPVPRKVIFLAKSEYFTGRGLKGLITKAFFAGVGQIPIDRAGGEASERAISTGLQRPGRRARARHLPRGHPQPRRPAVPGQDRRGPAGHRVRSAGRPVRHDRHVPVPAAHHDLAELAVRPGVRFGEPLDFSRYRGQQTDAPLLRTVTDEIMQAIAKLSGQEYVDIDARRAKADMAAAAAADLGDRTGTANRDDADGQGGNGPV